MGTFNLEPHQLTVAEVHHHLPPSSLYEQASRYETDSSIAENGAVANDFAPRRGILSMHCSASYDTTAKRLAALFRENFKKYESGVSAEIKTAGAA